MFPGEENGQGRTKTAFSANRYRFVIIFDACVWHWFWAFDMGLLHGHAICSHQFKFALLVMDI